MKYHPRILIKFHFLQTSQNMDPVDLSAEEKLKIVTKFLLDSPPGEVNEVFNGKSSFSLKNKLVGLI